MCHFITATLPAGADVDAAREVARRYRRGWEELENPHVARQLAEGERYFMTVRKGCDCGTELGSAGAGPPAAPDLAAEVAKLRKKGWSETKIERWLAEKGKTAGRRARLDAERAKPGADAQSWADLLHELASLPGASGVGVLLHWYSGHVESERIRFRVEEVGADELSAERLVRIEEDVLYRIRGRR